MSRLIDLTGRRFGKLTVAGRAKSKTDTSGRSRVHWLCKCDCGNTKVVKADCLKNSGTRSCGCLLEEYHVAKHKRITPGTVLGELTVLEELPRTNKKFKYICKCSCGKKTTVERSSLLNGGTVSCGHIRGMSRNKLGKHPLYTVYFSMVSRSTNKNNKSKKNYIERGVTLHPDWSNDTPKGFENFYNWAITDGGWKPGLQLDKEAINHDNLVYGPDTCKFVTSSYNISSSRKKSDKKYSSNYIGVCLIKTADKWKATVTYEYRSINVGRFSDELEAAKARDKYIRDNNLPHRLNFPNE